MFIKKTEEELMEQTNKIWNFLQFIHPELIRDRNYFEINGVSKNDLAIELRTLKRIKGEKPFYRNHRVYNYGDSQKEKLYKFLKSLNNKEIPFCMYYSVFNFDSKTMGISKSGNEKQAWNNCICLNNAVSTHILIMDFDDITEEKFIEQKMKLCKIGLDTTDIFSGHGYQSIIKLDKLCSDKEILTKFTNTLIKKGFKVDKKIKDCARIMRPPSTENSKDVLEGYNAIPTDIYYLSDKIYTVEEVFNKLSTLSNVIEIEDKESKKLHKNKESKDVSKDRSNEIKELKTANNNEINKNRLTDIELIKLYPMLNIKEIPDAIKLMLSGFQRGYANNVLMFLVTYFREQGLAKSIIIEIIDILKDLDNYKYEWSDLDVVFEVNRFYYAKDYNSKAVFFTELKGFGVVEYQFIDKSTVVINNYVFTKLANMSSSAFYIYVKLLEKQNYDNTRAFTLNEMSEIVGISRRSIIKHIDDLVKVKLLDKKRAIKKKGEEYTFFLSRFEQHKELGYTKFNITTLKLLLKMVKYKELTVTQLSICMYIKHICYNGKQNCTIAQETLGLALGISQSGISKAFKQIEKTELIRRDKEELNDFQFKYNYTIHY